MIGAFLATISSLTLSVAVAASAEQPLPKSVDQAGPSTSAPAGAPKGRPTAPPPPTLPKPVNNSFPTSGDPNTEQLQATSPFAGFMDPFDYDPRGRRDPFGQPIADKPMAQGNPHGPLLPLQLFELKQLRLTGIIWNVNNPKAMIRDPSGTVHVVGPNAKIGPHNGYVAVIREGEIVVVETNDLEGHLVSTAQVVRIAK